jgi:hypothetical protein
MSTHKRTCPAYGNYQPPYEECDCGAEEQGAMPAPSPEQRICTCELPDPVMQADRRFYCYRCSFLFPAVLCDGCRTHIVKATRESAPPAPSTLTALIAKWREQANQAGLEATRIYNTVKHQTGAQDRCYTRQDLWKKCADELEAALSAPSAPHEPEEK